MSVCVHVGQRDAPAPHSSGPFHVLSNATLHHFLNRGKKKKPSGDRLETFYSLQRDVYSPSFTLFLSFAEKSSGVLERPNMFRSVVLSQLLPQSIVLISDR